MSAGFTNAPPPKKQTKLFLIFPFPIYLEPNSHLPIYQVTRPWVPNKYRELEGMLLHSCTGAFDKKVLMLEHGMDLVRHGVHCGAFSATKIGASWT